MPAIVNSGGMYSSPALGSSGAVPLDTGDIDGLIPLWVSATQISIGTGSCRDDSDSEDLIVGATLTATITATGANGRNVDTAEAANKWYALAVISNGSTVAAFLINQDDLATFTYPSGYTTKRIVGWVRNDASSNLRKCLYSGRGKWRQGFYDVDRDTDLVVLSGGGSTSWSAVNISEWLPPVSTRCWMMSYGTQSACYVRPNGSSQNTTTQYVFGNGAAGTTSMEIESDSSQIIQYRVGTSGTTLNLHMGLFVYEV